MGVIRKDARTYADRRNYIIQAVSKRRRAKKALAIEYKGGKCQVCGYKKYAEPLNFIILIPFKSPLKLAIGATRAHGKK